MDDITRVYIYQEISWGDRLGFHLATDSFHGGFYAAEPLVMSRVDEDKAGIFRPPAMYLTRGACQAIFDQLYVIGLRPSRPFGDDEAVIKAQKEHIMDLRKMLSIDEQI